MKKRIAVFKNVKYDYDTIIEIDNDGKCFADKDSEHVRLTSDAVVDFQDLSKTDILSKQIEAIDAEIESVKVAFSEKINLLDQKKQELLALPSGECDE